MKKLRLDIESLDVQSFVAADTPEPRGTVRGHLPETHPIVCPETENFWCTNVTTCTRYIDFCPPWITP
jgi:hypothetical protein